MSSNGFPSLRHHPLSHTRTQQTPTHPPTHPHTHTHCQWLLDPPQDLNGRGSETGEGWYVFPRPEGKRCLVIAAKGKTVTRKRNGAVLGRFESNLPNGSRATVTGDSSRNYTILDCVFHEPDQT